MRRYDSGTLDSILVYSFRYGKSLRVILMVWDHRFPQMMITLS